MPESAEALFKARRVPQKPKFEVWLDSLDADDQAAFAAAATDPELTNQAIIDVVVTMGGKVHKETISAWRKRLGFRI